MSLADQIADTANHTTRNSSSKGTADVDHDGVTFNSATVGQDGHDKIAAGDWSPIFALFNLDPTAFEVVDETVRMSTWQQSKRTDSGDRDTIQLYAYSFRARRLTAAKIPAATVKAWGDALRIRDRARPAKVAPAAATYVVLVADPQIGKKGTAEAVENWQRGVTAHLERARALGPAVAAVHIGFMGDEFEGVANNYGNQPHTVELNQAAQIELAYDLEVWTVGEALKLRKPTTASAVVSNHGEWTRNGSKDPVTTRNDNGSTHLARQVRKQFDALAPFTRRSVDWTIGETHPGVVVNLSGVDCYFSHGYVEKGRGSSTEIRTKVAIERQILGRTDELGRVPLWFMAHYHHFYAQEFEGRTLFGCPALEAERSSEYMLDQFGVWSPPGVLGMLVGGHTARGWSDVNVL